MEVEYLKSLGVKLPIKVRPMFVDYEQIELANAKLADKYITNEPQLVLYFIHW